MSSRCPELHHAVLATLLALLAAGCSRESRRFQTREPGPGAGSITLSELQPGTPRSTATDHSPYAYNAYAISQGKRLFDWYNCSGCHAHGGGDIGPPLIDDQWIYGASIEQIHASIVEGRPNGMPSFRAKIPDAQAWQLAAYVRAMAGQVRGDVPPSRGDEPAAGVPLTQAKPTPPRAVTPAPDHP